MQTDEIVAVLENQFLKALHQNGDECHCRLFRYNGRIKGTVSCDSEMLKVSVMTSTSWFAQVLSTRPGMLSGPAALLIFTPSRVFSYIHYGYLQWLVIWPWCLPGHLTKRQLFWLWIGASPLHSSFWLGNDFIVFVITTLSVHLLLYDVTNAVYPSRLMWFSQVTGSLNMSQSPFKTVLQSSCPHFNSFCDSLTLLIRWEVVGREKQRSMVWLSKMGLQLPEMLV